ncbi:hypothetical protein J7L05_06515 [bacterium]|nr:hypothetical protein [bacterium]
MQFELGKMDFGTILDRGFKLFKTNFVPMVILMAIFFGPFLFAANIFMARFDESNAGTNFITNYVDKLMNNPDEDEIAAEFEKVFSDEEMMTGMGITFFLLFLMLAITPLVYLGVFRILSEHILGRTPSTRDVIRFAAGRFWTLVGAFILCSLIFYLVSIVFSIALGILGYALDSSMIFLPILLVPLFIFLVLAIVVFNILLPCVVCMEDVGSKEALKRTWWLLKGFWWRTFGIYLLAALLVAIITQIFLSIGQGIGGLIPGIAGNAFVAAISTLFTITFQPITLTIVFLLYLDIRIRKENFDLDILARRSFSTDSDETVAAQ